MTDPTLLSWINTEVERALAFVQESLARFSAAPQNEAVLQPCPEHLHQVSGALRMVGLSGATRARNEGAVSRASAARPTPAATAVIDRAVVALKNFVGELRAATPTCRCGFSRYTATGSAGQSTVPRRTFSTPMSAFRRRGTRKKPRYRTASLARICRRSAGVSSAACSPGCAVRRGLAEMRAALDALHQLATAA